MILGDLRRYLAILSNLRQILKPLKISENGFISLNLYKNLLQYIEITRSELQWPEIDMGIGGLPFGSGITRFCWSCFTFLVTPFYHKVSYNKFLMLWLFVFLPCSLLDILIYHIWGHFSNSILLNSTEKNMTIFFRNFWPKKSKVFDILVIKRFINKMLVIFEHF